MENIRQNIDRADHLFSPANNKFSSREIILHKHKGKYIFLCFTIFIVFVFILMGGYVFYGVFRTYKKTVQVKNTITDTVKTAKNFIGERIEAQNSNYVPTGAQLGEELSKIIGNKKKLEKKYMQFIPVNGSFAGMMASEKIGTEQAGDFFLSRDYEIQKKAVNSLSINLFKYLNRRKPSRKLALEQYSFLLQKILEASMQRKKILDRKYNRLRHLITKKNNEGRENEKSYFNAASNFDAKNASFYYKEFIKAQKETLGLKAEMGSIISLTKNYSTLIPQIETRIEVISKNKDALIAGVQVTDVKGMKVPLIIKK